MIDYDIEYTHGKQIKIVFSVGENHEVFFTIFLSKQEAWGIAKNINKLLRYKKEKI